MEYRLLGRSGLKVSALTLGTMTFGGAGALRKVGSTDVAGARTDEQLADNLKAAELTSSQEEIDRLEEVSRPNLMYPYWHQRNTASDRLSAADLALLEPYLSR